MTPENLNLDDDFLKTLKEKEGPLTVTYNNGEIKIVTEV